MPLKIQCPACRKRVPVEASDAGRAVLCLACGRPFRAPDDLGDDRPTPAATEAPALEGASTSAAYHLGADDDDDDDDSNDLVPGFPVADVPAAPGAGKARASPPRATARVGSPAPPAPTRGTAVAPAAARGGRPVWLGWAVAAGLGVAWLATTAYQLADRNDTPAVPAGPGVERSVPLAPEFPRRRVATSTSRAPLDPDGEDAPTADVAAAPVGPPGPATTAATSQDETASAPTGAIPPEQAAAAGPGAGGDTPVPAPRAGESGDADDAGNGGGVVRDESARNDESPAETRPSDGDDAPAAAPALPRVVRQRRGPLTPEPPSADDVDDERIEQAIRKGIDYLAGRYNPRTHELPGQPGYTILATYALIQCALTVKDPRLDPKGELMDKLVERIKTYPGSTYHCGVRATALALLNRPKDRDKLRQDVGCLVHGQVNGAYGYETAVPEGSSQFRFRGGPTWDNSNSQFGLLGVWSGAEVGIEVPDQYWQEVGRHWLGSQLRDGKWGYAHRSAGTVSMTAAGAASLIVANDYLSDRSVGCGRDAFPGPLGRALAVFEHDDTWLGLPHVADPDLGTAAYTLYSIERVGLATGLKYFGKHDWFRELARRSLDAQGADGSWSGDVGETCFNLLFLARGRPPIMMNKLRFNRYWSNRPRDAANLARYASRAMERPLNFQVADARKPWHDWMDAPILYVASHEPPQFGDAEYDKLRAFALAGGLIFTHADCDSARFSRFADDLVKRLFPQYEFVDLPADHPVYNLVRKVKPRPRLRAVSNGSRILLLHSPEDLGRHWQLREEKLEAHAFDLGLNLFVYATGKRDLRNRVDSPYVAPVSRRARSSIRVARVVYAGQWDPEPAAWPRFANLFRRRTGTALNVDTVQWKDLADSTAPVAHLTGTARYDPTAEQVAALKSYVEAGGTLLIDTCGGRGAFASEMKAALAAAFPGGVLDPVAPTHPMLNAGEPGMADAAKPKYRPFTAPKQGTRPGLFGFTAGKGQVILTTLDVTSGLLHTGTWGINGFDPTYCEAMVQNVVLWAYDSAPDRFLGP